MALQPDTGFSHQQCFGALEEAHRHLRRARLFLSPAAQTCIEHALYLVDLVGSDLRDWPRDKPDHPLNRALKK